jgi:DNA-directed RNA polymerase specialized sigma24 family protein
MLACPAVENVDGVCTRTAHRRAAREQPSSAERQVLRDALGLIVSSRDGKIRALPASRDVDRSALVEDVIRFKLQPNGWRAIRRFRGHETPVDSKKALLKYLGRIVDNHLADLFRSRSVVQDRRTCSLNEQLRRPRAAAQASPERGDVLTDATQPSPFEQIAAREEAGIVMQTIADIRNPTHRRIAVLSAAGVRPQAVAVALGISSNTVSIFLHRFRREMRGVLDRD